MEKEFVTQIEVAEKIGMKEQYLNILTEQEIKQNHIESELRKTEDDFFNSEFVEIPK